MKILFLGDIVGKSGRKAVIEKFNQHGYDAFLNRRRDKLMLEMLFIRKDLKYTYES